jgi:hypothetical protein
MLTAGFCWASAERVAQADVVDSHPPDPTGQYRTGLTKAGLVSVTSLSDARLWLGLRNTNDKSSFFDVRVELLNNGAPVASGLRRCVGNFAQNLSPSEVVVPWSSFASPTLAVGDVLALRVSTRVGTNSNGSKCKGSDHAAGLRISYDSTTRASRFGATITPDPNVDLYLHAGGGTGCNTTGLTLSEVAPTGSTTKCKDSGTVDFPSGNAFTTFGTWNLGPQCDCANERIPEVRNNPPAPAPEPVAVSELPLPPTAPSDTAGSCDAGVNPRGTGCISADQFAIQNGGWIDNTTVVANVTYTGAPAAPDPRSIYSGLQLIEVKIDGSTFANGDAWKCITCGLDPSHRQGLNGVTDYPQPYLDRTQNPPVPSVLQGSNIVQCSGYAFTDDANCTTATTFVYPIRWNQQGDGGGAGGSMRELRINPDGIHLGWNKVENYSFCPTCGAIPFRKLDQFAYFGRLRFNPTPATGTPAAPRFELDSVTRLYNPAPNLQPFFADPNRPGQLVFNPLTPGIGEFRGFTKDGKEAIGLNSPYESDNIDLNGVSLATGATRRLTRNPEYIDPIDASPDDNWFVLADTRECCGTNGRQLFMSAMPGIPPINDLITTGAVSSVRNNGNRRFFEPILMDKYGDRGSYQGQRLNACTTGLCTSLGDPVNDPNWNTMADPRWAPDGASIVYGERLVSTPDCGGSNPLPCPTSTEPGGRRSRMMLAELTSRTPLSRPPVAPVSDAVPWGTPFTPGSGACTVGATQTCPQPVRTLAPAGTWTLPGKVFGSATVNIAYDAATNPLFVSHVDATYTNYSDDGIHVINGSESVDRDPASTASVSSTVWHEHLTLSGCQTGTKVTSEPDGFRLTISIFTNKFNATGTLTTTIDGVTYTQPANNT